MNAFHNEIINYHIDGTNLKGHLIFDVNNSEIRPAVIVAPHWRGCDAFTLQKATELSRLGYIVFAADVYGDGKTATTDEESAALMEPLFLDRKLLQERIGAAFDYLSSHPLVDSTRIGAIGFCFGGLTVIELLRSGKTVAGAVSFHGVLGDIKGSLRVTLGIRHEKIKGSLLVLHGADDPLVTKDDIMQLENEMSDNGADWQIHIYGNTKHAFMNENANNPASGLEYNPRTAKRAWQSMINFFNEIFG